MKAFYKNLFVFAALLFSGACMGQTSNVLLGGNVVTPAGRSVALPVSLQNTSDIVAVQFTLTLPAGTSLTSGKVQWTDRRQDHVLMFDRKDKTKNQYLVVLYSPTNKPLLQRAGQLFSFELQTADTLREGVVYPLTLSDVILSDYRSGVPVNAMTDFKSGTLTIAPSPDVTVSNVTFSPVAVNPEDMFTVGWQVENIGGEPLLSGWTEYVYLVRDDAEGVLIASQQNPLTGGEFAAGASVNSNMSVQLPAVVGIDGTCRVQVRIVPYSDAGERPEYRGNNTAESTQTLTVSRRLIVDMPTEVNEGEEVRCLLYRTGNTDNDETFTLTVTGSDRVSVTEEVTIFAEEAGVTFTLTVDDNDIFDQEKTATLIITGSGYSNVEQNVQIIDDEQPTLSAVFEPATITEGGTVYLTITTDGVSSEDVTLYLSCSEMNVLEYPETVVLPAGEQQLQVAIQSEDDELPGEDTEVTFYVSAEGYDSAEATVQVKDDDVPTISLTVNPSAVQESAGPVAMEATVRRTGKTDNRVKINMSDDSNDALFYTMTSVILEADETEKTFTIGVNDNKQVDGDRVVTITAAVYLSSCSCTAGGSSAGKVTANVTIIDDDGPALKLTSASSALIEGGNTTFTVSRNTDTGTALSVQIAVDNAAGLIVPATVTIPAGASSAAFTVEAGTNSIENDERRVVFTVSADGFASSVASIRLTDRTLPDVQLTGIAVQDATLIAGQETTVTLTIRNTGLTTLSSGVQIKLYQNGKSLTTLTTDKAIAVNESVELSYTTDVFTATGAYTYYAVANPNQTVQELNYNNNTSDRVQVEVQAPFSAMVRTDKQTYLPDEQVEITGQVTGINTAESQVEVYVINNGFRETIPVTTDADGQFSVDFLPLRNQYGHFAIGACYPGEGMMTEMAGVDYYGLEQTEYVTCDIKQGQTYNGDFQLINLSSLPLHNIQVEALGMPEGVTMHFSTLPKLAGNAQGALSFTLLANRLTMGNDWEIIPVRITTQEGVQLTTSIYFYSQTEKGNLKTDISSINTTMVKDRSRDYSFVIYNTGAGETGEITFRLPEFMKLAGSTVLPSLTKGEQVVVTLRLTPSSDMAIGMPISGQIGINCANGTGLTVPFSVRIVSDATGALMVDVCDEYTYHTSSAPHVEGAIVQVYNPYTGELVDASVTNQYGLCEMTLKEGWYALFVSADRHEIDTCFVQIHPNMTTEKLVNLSLSQIKVEMTWEETEEEDVYAVTAECKFETQVPMPVVELKMPNYVPADELGMGESLVCVATLTNHGLITAQDVELILPNNFKHLTFEALAYNTPFDLPAEQSVNIPVKITKVASQPIAPRAKKGKDGNIDDDPCVGYPGTLYWWDCGLDRKWHRYGTALQLGSCRNGQILPPIIEPDPPYENSDDPNSPANRPSRPTIYPYPHPPGTPDFSDIPGFDMLLRLGDWLYSGSEDRGCEPCQNSFLWNISTWIPRAVERFGEGSARTVAQMVNHVFDFIADEEEEEDDDDHDYGFAEFILQLLDEENGDEDEEHFRVNPNHVVDLRENVDTYVQYFMEGRDITDMGNQTQKVLSDVGNVLPTLRPAVETVALFADLYQTLFEPCHPGNFHNVNLHTGTDNMPSKRRAGAEYSYPDDENIHIYTKGNDYSSYPSYIQYYLYRTEYVYILQNAYSDIAKEICGSESIIRNATTAELRTLFAYLTQWDGESPAVWKYKPQNISESDYAAFTQRWKNAFAGDENSIDWRKIAGYLSSIQTVEQWVNEWGYASVKDLFMQEHNLLMHQLDSASNSVCSTIDLQLSQKITMTRQAFKGTLTVENGIEDKAMEDVKLHLVIRNTETGELATSHEFQLTLESLEGFISTNLTLSEGWKLNEKSKGVAIIKCIPTKYAALTEQVVYSFGGTLSYKDPYTEETITRILSPQQLTVSPSPNLQLTYFMQRDVIADDPLTEEVETTEDAEFALLINNIGYGTAKNLRFTTQQPTIEANEKGLKVNFKIVSSQLNGEAKLLPLDGNYATDFGSIDSRKTAYAQWWFQSTLLGHFTKYDASYTHLTSYGNKDLSLIDTVMVREMIRSIYAPATQNQRIGWLTNDVQDANDQPDRIYFTDGKAADVSIAQNVSLTPNTADDYILTFTVSQTGYVYGNVPDPLYGTREIKRVVRNSDGQEISLRNVWLTNKTLRDGKDPINENQLHFADEVNAGTASYTISYGEMVHTPLTVSEFLYVPEQQSDTCVTRIDVRFSKDVNALTFTAEDVKLVCNGSELPASGIVISGEGSLFSLELTGLTADNGSYVLTINPSSIADAEGFEGDNVPFMAQWIQYKDGLASLELNVDPVEGGAITPMLTQAMYGETVALTAQSAEGYTFSHWSEQSRQLTTQAALEYLVMGDASLTAHFRLRSYQVTITQPDTKEGAIQGAVTGIYAYGTTMTLAATAGKGYNFVRWSDGNTDNPRTLIITSDTVIAAAFAKCSVEATDGATISENELPYKWEGETFEWADTRTMTLTSVTGCDSVVTFTLRVLNNNVVLQENENNAYYNQFALDYNGMTINTATLNRQFTQGKWATLCLPFDVKKVQMIALGLFNRIFEFRYAEQTADEMILVYFATAQSIKAGKGYIVNANAKLAQETSFVFSNVTINTQADNGDITTLVGYNDNSGRSDLYLVGTLRTGLLLGSTNGNTYLGLKDNKIYYPNMTTGTSIRAYRGFFRSETPINVQRIRIIVDGEDKGEWLIDNGEWKQTYIQAVKYIDNGILYIESNGIHYNAQGQRID